MKPLTCPDAQLMLSDLLAHAVEAKERQTLDEHLAACSECRRLAEELFRQDLLLLQATSSAKVDALAGRIRASLTSAAGTVRLRGWRRQRLMWLVGGMAASILIGVVLLWHRQESEAPVVRLDGEGAVFVIDGETKSAIGSGHKLAAGQALQTLGDNSQATLSYGDATQLILARTRLCNCLPTAPPQGAARREGSFCVRGPCRRR